MLRVYRNQMKSKLKISVQDLMQVQDPAKNTQVEISIIGFIHFSASVQGSNERTLEKHEILS